MAESYLKLKSGTDVRGVASNGVAGEEINLTDEAVKDITAAFVLWASKKLSLPAKELKIAVGHDSRISAERIKAAVIETLLSCGVYAVDCGLSSTPAMFMTTVDIGCSASVQITASHHPFNRNGLKFFLREGGLGGSDIAEVLRLADRGERPEKAEGRLQQYRYMTDYSARIRNMIIEGVDALSDREHPLKGYKIAVDAGNGAGGFFANEVLKPLGADVSGSRFLEPDGMFPNHIPNPENETAMASAKEAVLKSKSDLGVIFDTDVDRAAVVDSFGEEINRNSLIALAAAIATEGIDGAYIVTDSVTSDGLAEFIKNDLNAHHHRFKRGYRNVIDEAIRLNGEGKYCPLAIETSGHAALKENYFLDDGAYLATKIIIEMARMGRQNKKIGDRIKTLKHPAESAEHRVKLPDIECGAGIVDGFLKFAQNKKGWYVNTDSFEGVRVSTDKENGDGFVLMRMSVHDPVIPINAESNTAGGTRLMLDAVKDYMENVAGVKY